MVQVYRRKWVIHVERITREKVNGELSTSKHTYRLLQRIKRLRACCSTGPLQIYINMPTCFLLALQVRQSMLALTLASA